MKKAVVAALLLFFGLNVFAQIEDPVDWTFKTKDLGDGEYELRFIPKIEKGWYVYSQHLDEGGPVPTSFTFEPTADYKLLGEIEEPRKKIEAFDKNFNMNVVKYKRGVFKGKIKANTDNFIVKGALEYMTCDDTKCLPPEEVPFEFVIGKKDKTDNVASNGLLEPVKWSYKLKPTNKKDVFEMVWEAKIDDGWYLYSQIDDHPEALTKPQPTRFQFEQNDKVKYLDEAITEEGNLKDIFDKVFELQIKKFSKKAVFKRKVQLLESNAVINGYVEFMTCDDSKCIFPEPFKFAFNGKVEQEDGNLSKTDRERASKISSLIADCGNEIPKSESEDTKGKAPLMIFILGFLGGFAALLTPCVFPMIPMTVAFFTKQSKDRATGIWNALIYAVSIIIIYVSLGYLVTIIFGSHALNEMSTDPWFNLAFFAVFVIFAISFFGYFEITLPSWLVNKSDQASDKGGLIGIFFMAFTLVLVSFSCTGPIIGTLLVEAAATGATKGPLLGMFGFALALALPFALFAAFPGWLNTLPKSGGWLDVVKKVLGFIELILAVKFLSNADLVKQWGLVKLETFYIIWIILFVAMGLYLFSYLRFKYDMKIPLKKLGWPRIALGIASFAFAIYLIPGIFCQERSLVSGFPPPTFYSYGCHGHHIQDLGEAQAVAKKEGKPVLVDFTGWACVNCRKMETNVWTKPEIAKLMDQYTIASLYVDEKIDLPENEWFKYKQGNKIKTVKTVGNKWSFLQANCLETNSQPYYVLLNDDSKILNTPVGYTPDVSQYASFLQEGLDNYKAGKYLIQ